MFSIDAKCLFLTEKDTNENGKFFVNIYKEMAKAELVLYKPEHSKKYIVIKNRLGET